MYKTIQADRDSYITNKVINKSRKIEGNVGGAGSLDLFKLYGASYSGSIPNVEISRLLVHFDLTTLKTLISQKKIDVSDPSFWCKIKLKDIYGGQPTPANFTISVFPLSGSFEEGLGRDTVYYSDNDSCNWITASLGSKWFISGCSKQCDAQLGGGDYITSSLSIQNTEVTQFFKKGTEDLFVDVTSIISSTISGELPDSGFRVSYSGSIEEDNRTYFVKRFGSRTVYDESKRPELIFGFNDSMIDDSQNLTFDSACNIFLRNYSGGSLANILSGSSLTEITGSNSLILKLTTQISGGYYNLYFTGSQFSYGTTGNLPVSGTYFASVTLPSSDLILSQQIHLSSSLKFTPIWTSLDDSVVYVSGSSLYARSPTRTSSYNPKKFIVSVLDVKEEYRVSEEGFVRVNIFDHSSPLIKVTKIPVELPGIVVRNASYQIRNSVTNEIVIPFDSPKNSTKLSSDSEGMFFKFDPGSLFPGRTYVFDIVIDHNGVRKTYKDSSSVFRVIS